MISKDITETFQPYWLTASTDSALTWPAAFVDPAQVTAVAKFVAVMADGSCQDLGEVRREPTPQGSFLQVTEDAVTLHLTAGDKQLMTGPTLFALAVEAGDKVDEAGGQIVVSDWGAEPHRGTA